MSMFGETSQVRCRAAELCKSTSSWEGLFFDAQVLSSCSVWRRFTPLLASSLSELMADGDHDMVAVDDVIDLECETTTFAKIWNDKMFELLSKYASPAVYLQEAMPSLKEMQKFAQWLWKTFPERDDTLYQHTSPIPAVTEEQMAQSPPVPLHLAALGFQEGVSLKPAPGREHTLELIAMFLKDGFITASDVLLISQPAVLATANSELQVPWGKDSSDAVLGAFSVGYIKGRARVTSLFALLFAMYEADGDDTMGDTLQSQCFKFWDSCRVVWAQHFKQATKEDEALQNMKLSLRGSLRKAANIVQVATMIRKLLAEGHTDFNSFLRRWNQQTVTQHQIRGRKLVSLKLLFEQTPRDHACPKMLVVL